MTQETPELYKWITGQKEAPEKIKNNLAFKVKILKLKICKIR